CVAFIASPPPATYTLSLHDLFRSVVVAGVPVPRGWPMLALVWALVLAVMLASHVALRGRWSRAFALLRARPLAAAAIGLDEGRIDRKSTRLNSSHVKISYAVFCLK